MNSIQGINDFKIDTRSLAAESKLKHLDSAANFESILSDTVKKTDSRAMDKQHKKLWDTCVETESLFVNSMLKEMRKSIHKGEWLHGGFAEEIFEDMLYDKYSLEVSKNSNLGMAKMLYDELSRKM